MRPQVVELLHQAEVWIDATFSVHRLDTMDPHHRSNLIPFLRGNKRTLFCLVHDVVPDAQTAEEWLESTPLMRRLVELEAGRPIDDRRATAERNAAYERATGYQKVRLG